MLNASKIDHLSAREKTPGEKLDAERDILLTYSFIHQLFLLGFLSWLLVLSIPRPESLLFGLQMSSLLLLLLNLYSPPCLFWFHLSWETIIWQNTGLLSAQCLDKVLEIKPLTPAVKNPHSGPSFHLPITSMFSLKNMMLSSLRHSTHMNDVFTIPFTYLQRQDSCLISFSSPISIDQVCDFMVHSYNLSNV